MPHDKIKALFSSAIQSVTSRISDFSVHPGKDFTRRKKFPADKLLTFLVSEGSSSTKNELLDFFDMDADKPTDSAFNQQRAKLMPEAVEAVFHKFNESVGSLAAQADYRFLAADGSTATFFSRPEFSSAEYFVKPGHSARGFYSIHINAFYDLERHTYTDAVLQPVHQKDEFRAFCDIVDRHPAPDGTKNVYIGDRGYCSYNNMAHVLENQQYFLFRTKDIHSKGLVGGFDFPEEEAFDIDVDVTLVRSHSSKIKIESGCRRFVDKATSFDFIEYGSKDTYRMTFRIVRFSISDGVYECTVTNLPRDEFPPERIKRLYFSRWGIETSFRKLKYTVGLSNFHAYKPEYVKQEIWARMITYNLTETLVNQTIIEKQGTKHDYKVNFSSAVHICRSFLRPAAEERPINVTALLQKELIPIRNERQYPRLKTAHFRKPRYFIYRAA